MKTRKVRTKLQKAAAQEIGADGLSPVQTRVMAHLLRGASQTEAAVAEGLSRSAVNRWCNDAGPFKSALERGSREIHRELFARVPLMASCLLGTLERIATNPKESATARIAAIRLLLEKVTPYEADMASRLPIINIVYPDGTSAESVQELLSGHYPGAPVHSESDND
jgi:hypothetical protein